nr:MAG TPA: hypothetical protein [Caudoviricetes sp.]
MLKRFTVLPFTVFISPLLLPLPPIIFSSWLPCYNSVLLGYLFLQYG